MDAGMREVVLSKADIVTALHTKMARAKAILSERYHCFSALCVLLLAFAFVLCDYSLVMSVSDGCTDAVVGYYGKKYTADQKYGDCFIYNLSKCS